MKRKEAYLRGGGGGGLNRWFTLFVVMLCSLLGTHKNLGIKFGTNIATGHGNEKYKKKIHMHYWAKNSSVA